MNTTSPHDYQSFIEDYFIHPFDNAKDNDIEKKLLSLGYRISEGEDIFEIINEYRHIAGSKDKTNNNLKINMARYILYLRNDYKIYKEDKDVKKDEHINEIIHGSSLEKVFHSFLMELMMRYMRPNKNINKKPYLLDPALLTEDKLKEINRWAEIKPETFDIISDNDIFYPGDKPVIEKFNKECEAKCGDEAEVYKYMTKINPEPFTGNVLDAKIIILSLNPGYVDRCNRMIGRLIKNRPRLYEPIKKFKLDSLTFQTDYFELQDEDLSISNKEYITCNEAYNLLGEYYWHDKLMKLTLPANYDKDGKTTPATDKCINMPSKLPTYDDVMKKVALVQYVPYQSNQYYSDFKMTTILPSQIFTLKLLSYLSKKKDTYFLILRSRNMWEQALDSVYTAMGNSTNEKKQKISRIISKDPNKRSQDITPNNLNYYAYNSLIKILNDN